MHSMEFELDLSNYIESIRKNRVLCEEAVESFVRPTRLLAGRRKALNDGGTLLLGWEDGIRSTPHDAFHSTGHEDTHRRFRGADYRPSSRCRERQASSRFPLTE